MGRRGEGRRAGICMVLGLALALGSAGRASPPDPEIPVPVDLQASLLRRILPFDRNLGSRAGTEVRIGVVYQELWRISTTARDAFAEAMRANGQGARAPLAITCVPLPLTEAPALREAVKRERIDVLYVAPIRAFDVAAITEIARATHVLSVSALPELVAQGLSVGFRSRAGKPVILVNRTAAKAEGVDFESRLLDLAEVIP